VVSRCNCHRPRLPTPRYFRRRPLRPPDFDLGSYGGWGSRRCPSAFPSFGRPATIVAPSNQLGKAAVAAFQAFARPGVEPVEFASGERTEAQAWLTARLTHPVYIPADPSAVPLVGARIAPYSGSPAAFLVYESQQRAVGLLIQSLDAPATNAPRLLAAADGSPAAVWTWRSQGFALVGDLDAALLLKIATDFFDPPVEAAQTAPERGW
jgi:anti-sigma factor RsiW